MRYASSDPGKTGSIVLLEDDQPLEFSDMLMQPSGKLIDVIAIADLFWKWNIDHIVLEKVGTSPQMGVSSAGNFMANWMGIQGLAAGMEVKCTLLTPQRWKTYMGLIGKPKDAARLKAIEMFPELAPRFKFKNSVDSADALLMGLVWWKTVGVKL